MPPEDSPIRLLVTATFAVAIGVGVMPTELLEATGAGVRRGFGGIGLFFQQFAAGFRAIGAGGWETTFGSGVVAWGPAMVAAMFVAFHTVHRMHEASKPFETRDDPPEPVDVPDVPAPYSRDQYAEGRITLATYEQRVTAALDDEGERIHALADEVDGLGPNRCEALADAVGDLERLAYHPPANVAWQTDGIGDHYAEAAVDAARAQLPEDGLLVDAADADAEVLTAET